MATPLIRLYNSTLTANLSIYSYGNSINYELNTLPISISQCGNFYPQPIGNEQLGNIKRVWNFTLEYIDNDEKDDIINFYKNVEGSKNFSMLIRNSKEDLFNISEVNFNSDPKFNQPDIDWWNCSISIREV